MKRIILSIILALTACVSLSAQQQGDKAVAAYVGLDLSTVPNSNFEILAEFDYFVVDNVRASFAVGMPVASRLISKVGDEKLKQNTVGVYFNPNVAYYCKLADNIFYTPELGATFGLGSFKNKFSSTVLEKGRYNGFCIYLYPVYFEIQVNARMAIGVALGELCYENFKFRDTANQIVDRTGDFSFHLNSGSICWRYYL